MNKFEKYLSTVHKKQKWMIYISIVCVIVLVIHNVSAPLLEKHETLYAEIETLQKSVTSNAVSNIKKEIASKSKALLQLNAQIETQKETITSLMSSLYGIKYAFFNEKEFANTLDGMLKQSIKGGVDIEYIKNIPLKEAVDAHQILKHKKRIEIRGNGGYKEIVSFINHMENFNVLSKFSNITMKSANEKVTFVLLWDVYGVGL
jgi:hypothetical protein